MVLYNTLMGVCAGLALILAPVLMRKLYRRQAVSAEGWSVTFGVLGSILTFLSGAMAVTWPLTANPPINIAFSEPSLVLGVLLVAASIFLWARREAIAGLGVGKHGAELAEAQLDRTLMPVSWILFALGLILAAITAAIFRFMLVGSAPEAEPISGRLHDAPWVENTFFGVIYGLSALGALLAPWGLQRERGATARRIMGLAWTVAGICFLLFSVMNYYTHIGLLVNLLQGKHYKF